MGHSRAIPAMVSLLLATSVGGCGKTSGASRDSAASSTPDSQGPTATGGGGGSVPSGTGGAGGAGGVASSTTSSASGGSASGGSSGAGGATGSGGAAGAATTGGSAGGSGGATGSGGVTGAGGTSTTGGAGGTKGSGGTTGSGGNADASVPGGSGGVTGSGGATGTGGNADAAKDAGPSLAADSLAVRFANAVMSRWPDPNNITTTPAFEYNHGIVLRGMEQVYRRTSDARYLTYIQKYIDSYVSGSGAITLPAAHSFDNIQPAVLLPFLYQKTGSAKYQTAADTIRARYDSIPRNADKGFWHKQTYPNQMWLDSIYMGEPFLARYGAVFGTCGTFCASTVTEQVNLIAQHVQDPTTGLLYHAWDDSAAGQKAAWADATTGRSPVIWGRAMGWYAMALVDMLDDLPTNQAGRSQMLTSLASMAAGIKSTQDPATGLWYQVVDQGSKSDDWLETSGSGMFVYALKVGVARGYIDASYLTVANSGWQGLKTKVTNLSSGTPSINGAVQGMSVQTTYALYINQTALTDSPHGLCAILLAAAEMEAQ